METAKNTYCLVKADSYLNLNFNFEGDDNTVLAKIKGEAKEIFGSDAYPFHPLTQIYQLRQPYLPHQGKIYLAEISSPYHTQEELIHENEILSQVN